MKDDIIFNIDEFHNPPSIFWPGYFWILNDQIDGGKLIDQLYDMYNHGARSLCLLPEPPEFRPLTFGTELDIPYLSEAYFRIIQRVVDECEKLGMNYWLYDEGGWPSGAACGQVYNHNPEKFKRKSVECSEEITVPPGKDYLVPDDCLIAYADDKVYRPGESITPSHNPTVKLYRVVAYAGYPQHGAPHPNLLVKEVTETFIELTHKQYKKYVGSHFGKTIRFTFTDEPALPPTSPKSLTWVDDLPNVFREKKGYDLLDVIPYLLAEPSDDEPRKITQARIDFYDVWSQMFVERYFVPIRDWCRENKLLSGGHRGGEDEPIGNAIHGYGHILRTLRAFDLPGIDAIWRQIFPGLRNPPFPKYASSVARQMNQPYVLTESFGVYGNGVTPQQMKWITDQQYLRGASLMVMVAYPYSTRDQLMPGERPHFGPVNPLWKYMDIYHTYTARLGYLLTRGKPVCNIAVYYDIRSIWAGASTQKKAIELHEAIADILLSAQCDFDFIDDDSLANSTSSDGKLTIGAMEYTTVITPATQWMAPEAIEGLKRFVESGGNLIIVGGDIDGYDGPAKKIELHELAKVVEPLVRFDPPCKDIRVCKRRWNNTTLYFLNNESPNRIKIQAFFDEQSPPVLCSLEEGKFYLLPDNYLEFAPWSSMVILFGVEADEKIKKLSAVDTIELNHDWTLKPIKQYRVGEHDFEIIEMNESENPVELGDWREYLGEYFSGDARYTVEFDCSKDLTLLSAKLDLGEVKYACQVILNNEPIARRVWYPFEVDITGKLKAGKNKLEIIVTNTLANALLNPQVERDWYSKTGPGWPSNGLVYDKLSRNFEKDSLPSGLYGPVRITFTT